MAGWRKALIISIAMIASVAAVASGSSDSSSGGSKKSSDTTAAGSSKDSGASNAGDANEVKEVKINSCTKDPDLGYAQANITTANGSSKASDYLIEITFESKDGKTQIGTGNAIVSNLAPGQSKTEDVSSLETPSTEFTCKVSKVDRIESL